MLEGVGGRCEGAACRLQTILVHTLDDEGVTVVEEGRAIVLVGSVDTVGPHVHAVAVHGFGGVVVPELEHSIGACTCPVAALQDGAPCPVGTYTHSVGSLVHNGTGALVRCVGTDTHPSAV